MDDSSTDLQTSVHGQISAESPVLLLPSQQHALDVIAAQGTRHGPHARQELERLLVQAGIDPESIEQTLCGLWRKARIMIHFHPERLDARGRSVAAGLLADGRFKTQFETGLSSGSTSAFDGGARDRWEHHLFAGAYHAGEYATTERPKYGALDLLGHPDGPAPRFGSCYFVLQPEVCGRASFTFGGSQEPDSLSCSGTREAFLPVLVALLAELAQGNGGLGDTQLGVRGLWERLNRSDARANPRLAECTLGRALDSFIEAQIHGPLDLERDAEKLVADPCFRGGPIEEVLQAICFRYQLRLDWHPGFQLSLAEVPDSFRGYAVRPLAERAASQSMLDAAGIGALENDLKIQPLKWQEWGGEDEMLTRFRRLWHVLVLLGQPRSFEEQAN